jgi:hypothetical protein
MTTQASQEPRKNTSPFPDPPHAFEVDVAGNPYYSEPIPGFDENVIHHRDEYLTHIPYLFYADKIKNDHGGGTVYQKLYKGCRVGPRIALTWFDEEPLRAPYGASVYIPKNPEDKGGDPNRPTLELSIDNKKLLDFLQLVDKKNLSMALSHGKRWFKPGGTLSMEAFIQALYCPTVIPPPEPKEGQPKKDYNPTFRTKVVLKGKNATVFRMKTGEKYVDGKLKWIVEEIPPEEVSIDLLPKGVRCMPVVDMYSLWFVKQFGQSIQCSEIYIVPSEKRKTGMFSGAEVEVVKRTEKRKREDEGTQSSKRNKEEESKSETERTPIQNYADDYTDDYADDYADFIDGATPLDDERI